MSENLERSPKIKLKWSRDFKAGHYPGGKTPPWGIDDALLSMNHPELDALVKTEKVSPGEEKLICSAEIELPNGETELVDIKLSRYEERPSMLCINAYPRSDKYYKEDDGMENE